MVLRILKGYIILLFDLRIYGMVLELRDKGGKKYKGFIRIVYSILRYNMKYIFYR